MSQVQVVIKDALVVDTSELDTLMEILVNCGVELTIKPVAAQAQDGGADVKPKSSRRRKPKVEEKPKEEKPKAEEPKEIEPEAEEPEAKQESSTDEVTYDHSTLLEKFTTLIDKDYDAALNLLEEHGVKTFNELGKGEYTVFGAKIDKLLGG